MSERRAAEDIQTLVRQAVAFHEREAADAVKLWRDGLDLVLRALDPMNGQKNVAPEHATRLALIITALQSLSCAHDLAVRGYYLQALNLVRAPYEYVIASMYLSHRPKEHASFTDLQQATPKFNVMKQRISSALRKQHGKADADQWEQAAQAWIDGLHPFSHVDKQAIQMVTKASPAGVTVVLGPDENAWFFTVCAEKACAGVAILLGAAMLLRDDLGYGDIPDVMQYVQRFDAWRQGVVSARGNAAAVAGQT